MLESLLLVRDKFLYDHFWRLQFLPYEMVFKYDFPTKRMIRHAYNNHMRYNDKVKGHIALVSTMYLFDSNITKDNLQPIHDRYGTTTRERVRQILAKFIRQYYN